jgi:3'-5' exoribonuclease
MARRFLNELVDGERLDDVYLASEKQLRPNRAGNLYLQVRLSDRTGSLNCMLWNAEQAHYDLFQNGDYIRVRGAAQLYNERMQVIARSLEAVDPASIDVADFEAVSEADVRALSERLTGHLRAIENPHLRSLTECVLVDDGLMARFKRAPAGIKNHHAWHGGLLEHVVQLIDLAAVVAPLYAEVDGDLLVTGVLFHDIGKTEELTYEPDFSYTDAGQLLGHLVQGVAILERKIVDCEKQSGERFPDELALRLKHMIVSHHGELEMGSPRVPMTPEALVLHFLDNMDAKLASVRQILAEDANHGSTWTVYNAQLGRKIFKGLPLGR